MNYILLILMLTPAGREMFHDSIEFGNKSGCVEAMQVESGKPVNAEVTSPQVTVTKGLVQITYSCVPRSK